MPAAAREGEEEARLKAAIAAMTHARRVAVRRRRMLASVFDAGGIGDWHRAEGHVRSIAFACRLCGDPQTLAAYRRLVLHAEAHAGRLLHRRTPSGERGYVMPLLRLAEQHTRWRAEPERWRPRHEPAAAQFAHLCRFVVGEAAAAFVADAVSTGTAVQVRSSVTRTAGGKNVRTLSHLPVYLTARMAERFAERGRDADFIRALRWGQWMGLGGEPALARALQRTRLARQLWDPAEERWWLDFLVWLAAHPQLQPPELAPLLEYVLFRRYGSEHEQRPPDPGFSVKGRSPQALLRRADEWRGQAPKCAERGDRQYRACGVQTGRWERETPSGREEWTIEELLDRAELAEEGRKLRHCIASYGHKVAQGRCSIWSLRRSLGGTAQRAVTVQLALPALRIVQCRGRANRPPSAAEREILLLWATENDLTSGIKL